LGYTVIWGWGGRVNYINRANAAGAQPRVYLKFAHDEFVGSGNGVDTVVQRVVGLRSEKPLHA
jgi:hypothetical protein